MSEKSRKSLWQVLAISGIIGVTAYTAHVIIGGFLWKGYNHITQTISELTGSAAPDAGFLQIFTTIYGIMMVVFSLSAYFIFRQRKAHKVSVAGAVLLVIMEASSFVGYSLFPLDTSGALNNFQNIMHMVVTGAVVVTTIGAFLCMGIGLRKTPECRKLGNFVFVCACIIVISGFMTPAVMAANLPMAGLTERLNIFTIQICLFVLSVNLFRNPVAARAGVEPAESLATN